MFSAVAAVLVVLGIVLVPAPGQLNAAEIGYIYDDVGRLRAVIDPTSDSAVHNYDAVGNLLSTTRHNTSTVALIEFSPKQGPVGTPVTIYGTGFSSTAAQNTVTFNGTGATVTSSTETRIDTAVPSGATTGAISVTSPNGSAASSSVFTVTSSTGTPTITGFTPSIGTPSTAVTVTGTNFEASQTKNSLRFNNTTSVVTASTTTSLDTTVPGQTASGRISVATPNGKAVSSDDFFIPPPPYSASDVEYTGRMTVDGATHTIGISTAGKIGLVVFDGIAGQKMSLGLNSTTISTSSDLWIYNPNGTTLSGTSTLNLGGHNNNFHFALPVTGTYSIMVDPDGSSTGSVALTLSSEVDGGPILLDGASVTLSIPRVGQIGFVTFSGSAGQTVSLGVSSQTISTSSDLYIYNPDGSTLAETTTLGLSQPANFHVTLPATETYRILVDPHGTSTGSVTLTLSSEVDGGAIVVDGSSVSLTMTRIGQRGFVSFSGTAGQAVSLGISSPTISNSSDLEIHNPDGSTLLSSGTLGSNYHLTLPANGTYKIVVDPYGDNTGSVTLTLSSEVDAGTISVDGTSVSAATTRIGQRARIEFTGSANQIVSLGATATSPSSGNDLIVLRPDGSTLTSTGNLTTGTNFHMTLPTTGTYAILLDPDGNNTGSATFLLSSEVDGGSLTINGSATPVSISRIGQRARLTFAGTSGQQVTVRLTSNSIGLTSVALLRPNGTQQTISSSSSGSFNLNTQSLSTTGTYTILVDPANTNTGSITVAVTEP